MHIEFTAADVEYFLVPREGVIEAYVVQDPESGEITDFISFYCLPSSVLRHEIHKTLWIAYAYYFVPGKYSMVELMRDALVLAKQKGYDVLNALDIMDNEKMLEELKFGVGDGHLQYYFYNWRIPNLGPGDIGMVLV